MGTWGVVTIGQAPRHDLVPDLAPCLRADRIEEAGALDGLDRDRLRELKPRSPDAVLVTRLADGESVHVDHHRIRPLLEAAIARVEAAGADAVLVACTGDLAGLAHRRALFLAGPLIHHGASVIVHPTHRVAVICPDAAQRDAVAARWAESLRVVGVFAASPYRDPEPALNAAVQSLLPGKPDVVIMDCMGYTPAMANQVRQETRLPVILARDLVARLAGAWGVGSGR
jgi:protein AroM